MVEIWILMVNCEIELIENEVMVDGCDCNKFDNCVIYS